MIVRQVAERVEYALHDLADIVHNVSTGRILSGPIMIVTRGSWNRMIHTVADIAVEATVEEMKRPSSAPRSSKGRHGLKLADTMD